MKKYYQFVLVFVFLTVLVEGCAPASTPVPPPTLTPAPPTFTPEPTATFTPLPSPTPIPGKLVLPVDTLGKSIPWLPLDKSINPGVAYVGFNTAKPPFNSALVRRAFAYAIDRQAIFAMADKYGTQNASPATTITPPQTLGRDLYGIVGAGYDPQKAQDLLAQAGYTDPSAFPKVLFLVNVSGEVAPGARFNMANAMVKMWQTNLGITVEVQAIQSFSAYNQRLADNPPDLFWMGWSADYNDPANFFDDIFSPNGQYDGGINFGRFSDPALTDLMARASASQDPAERQLLYIEAERLLCETEAAIIPLYHRTYDLR